MHSFFYHVKTKIYFKIYFKNLDSIPGYNVYSGI
jgi:hypothetical protein